MRNASNRGAPTVSLPLLLLLLLLQLVLCHNWLPYSIFLAPFQLPGVIEGEATCSVQLSKTTSDVVPGFRRRSLLQRKMFHSRPLYLDPIPPTAPALSTREAGTQTGSLRCGTIVAIDLEVQLVQCSFGEFQMHCLFDRCICLFVAQVICIGWVVCKFQKVVIPGGSIKGLHIYKSSCWNY